MEFHQEKKQQKKKQRSFIKKKTAGGECLVIDKNTKTWPKSKNPEYECF